MTKKKKQRTSARGGTVSGALATVLTGLAKAMVLATALSPRGALRRSLLVPILLMAAAIFRWWSLSYLGQRLGLAWSKQTYQTGALRVYEPSDIGNAWKQFANGRVTMRPQSRR